MNTGFTVTPGVGDTIVIGLSLTSANDAPERDPASYTLDGSNDGANFVPISSGSVPPFPTRFLKSYIFFPNNTKSFKSYRLIFPTVANAGAANSMQISEVEFLGVTPGVINTNPVDNLIRRQPQDTPVLLGSAATFRVGLTGPWKVQWFRNDVRIPGANNATYTTPPATAGDDGALFKAVVQSPQGVQVSDEVMLSIFTPSVTESIALSWVGGGANGAPTAMLPDDITGFHPQAYWNNLIGGSGTLTAPRNSSNRPNAEITVVWSTSGEWGVGTGNSDATERMLNGMATSFSTTEGSAQTVTISGIPAGNHSLFLYTVQVPQEFFNMDFAVVTHDTGGNDVIQRRFIRPQNSEEYNASPGFSLVTSDTAASRSVGNTMRFDNLQAGPDGVIQIRFFSPGRVDLPGGDPIRGPGLNGLQLLFDAPPVGTPPTITQQPVSANGIVGGQVTLTVQATGPNLSYEWLKNGQPIAGATSPLLTLSNLETNDAGIFSVVISNPAGRVASRPAVVGVVASAQITFGLITYFKLDEEGEVTVTNSAPGGMNGQIPGSFPDTMPGQIGNALVFDGASTYVLVPNYPKVSKAMTVAGWVLPPGNLGGPLINNWVEGRTTGSSGQFLVDLVRENDITMLRALIEVGPNRVSASAPVDDDPFVFHHFAMSADGVTLSIYWDGRLIGTVDYLGLINSTPSLPWLSLGGNLTGDPVPVPDPTQTPNLLRGALDDVAIWNRSLSDIEIQGIYNGGLSGQNIAQVAPVLNINRSPLANDDSATTLQGAPVTINVLANDTDPDTGDTLTVTSTTSPAHGTAVINANNTVTYTPNAGYSGPDGFNYTIGDGHGGIGSAVVQITVTSPPGPILVCSTNIVAQCTGGLTPVTYIVSAVDFTGSSLPVNCTPPSGSGFPLGQSNVTCTATDSLGKSTNCTFTVTVRDTTPPNTTCPENLVAECAGPGGTLVAYNASAVDACDGAVPVTCTPPSGAAFPPGETTVNCSARDSSGNEGGCSFKVTVVDTVAPVINCPNNISVLASNQADAVVTFNATATDACAGTAPISCSPASGSTFPPGTNSVTCMTTDAAGHSATCSFSVIVTVVQTGARSMKEDSLARLNALRATVTDKEDQKKLDEAIEHLTKSLDPDLWIDQDHLQRKKGDRVFHEDKEAAHKLEELQKDKKSTLSDAALQSIIDSILAADRRLAVIAVDDAEATGVKPKKIAEDRREIEKGDEEAARGKSEQAIDHYRNAWKHAVHIKIKPLRRLAGGGLALEFLAVEGQTYIIQASTNLIDWVTLGTAKANDEGVVEFDDESASRYPVRFYRVGEPDSTTP